MLHRMSWLVLAVVLALPAFGGEAEKGDGPRRPRPGMILKFVMDHAQDLGLTDEQKQKIETLIKERADKKPPEGRPEGEGRPEDKPEGREGRHGKGPLADILTEEQNAKLRELLKAGRPERKDKPEGETEKF